MIPNGDIPAYHAGRAGPVRWALKHGDEVLTWGELDVEAMKVVHPRRG
jgi:hypothetical protein